MTTGSQGTEEVARPGAGSTGNPRPKQLSTRIAHPGPPSKHEGRLQPPGVAGRSPGLESGPWSAQLENGQVSHLPRGLGQPEQQGQRQPVTPLQPAPCSCLQLSVPYMVLPYLSFPAPQDCSPHRRDNPLVTPNFSSPGPFPHRVTLSKLPDFFPLTGKTRVWIRSCPQ